MAKKNEEKAREIAINNRQNYFEGDIGWGANTLTSECECYDSAMTMAELKDEQLEVEKQALIDKACEWLEPVLKDLAGYNCAGDLINDFKKAMKGD